MLFSPQSVFRGLIFSGVSVAKSLFIRKENMTGIIRNKIGENKRTDMCFIGKSNVSLK